MAHMCQVQVAVLEAAVDTGDSGTYSQRSWAGRRMTVLLKSMTDATPYTAVGS